MNPAEHSARADAERSGTVVGSDVDRIEAELMAELIAEQAGAAGDEGEAFMGAWLEGEFAAGVRLWGVVDV